MFETIAGGSDAGMPAWHGQVAGNPELLSTDDILKIIGWLRASLAPEEFKKLEAANTDRPKAQALFGIQARNLAKLNAAGARITLKLSVPGHESIIEAPGEVAPARGGTAVRFLELHPADRELLQSYIQELQSLPPSREG